MRKSAAIRAGSRRDTSDCGALNGLELGEKSIAVSCGIMRPPGAGGEMGGKNSAPFPRSIALFGFVLLGPTWGMAVEAGVEGCLEKPVDLIQLPEHIPQVLASCR
jgi:hypothetical protein